MWTNQLHTLLDPLVQNTDSDNDVFDTAER